MQYDLGFSGKRTRTLHGRLIAAHGAPPGYLRLDPVSQLVLSMLGSHTYGEVSIRAFVALRRRFVSWDAVRETPSVAIERIIRPVTYSERKAAWLPAALRRIVERRRRLELDFLRDYPVEAAQSWLMTLPGVGPKVSAAVLNFSSLRMRALVVDSHHYRVAGGSA